MKLNQDNMKYIYDTISSIFKLNFIIISMNNEVVRLSNMEFPQKVKLDEEKMINYLSKKYTLKEKNVVVYFECESKLKYMIFNVYEEDKCEGHMILGPYINYPIQLGVKDDEGRSVDKMIPIINILQEKSIENIVLALINTKLGKQKSIFIEDQNNKSNSTNNYIKEFDMSAVNVRARYKLEEKLLHYVSMGNKERAMDILEENGMNIDINRFPEAPIRNMKNFAITINTLLRKAVQENNIDPYFLDNISEHFAKKIENTNNIDILKNIFEEMIKEYCDLVSKYMNKGYSKLVSETINYIKLNFKYEIGLSSISKEMFVHPTYLAKKFKAETKKTLTEYINEIRTKEAKIMLQTTEFKIEDIAYYVGYNDKKYFAKVFKKIYDVTPSDYRKYR